MAAESSRDGWWVGAVGYEIYVRSFQDSNGDGIGDLPGITSRLDYLAWLGIDALWMTPFFPSPGFDHGYDVSDYLDVDPIHGTLDDFDDLVEAAHGLGLKVIVDVVPNHTSSQHRWFVDALEGKDSPYRDYYVWRAPGPDGEPPNNWVSHFGGPAWTLDQASGEYYCHLFLPEQPDLNWDNEAVRREFDDILRFWLDRGADGFRIDVAHGLVKASDFADNPQLRPLRFDMSTREVWESFVHQHDVDQDLTVGVYRRWNEIAEPYGAILLGELGVPEPHRVARYTRESKALHAAFYLKPVHLVWEPDVLLSTLRAMHEADPDGIAWVADNHDAGRSASRYGGGARGARRSLAVMTLMTGLGGTPFLYQGQELGLEDGRVHPDDLEDPMAVRNVNTIGRDGARSAMPWSAAPGNGFTSGTPWLAAADRSESETVEIQRKDPHSELNRHRQLVTVRRSNPDLWQAPAEWIDVAGEEAALILRGSVAVAANLAAHDLTFDLPEATWSVEFSSAQPPPLPGATSVVVPAETALILSRT